jgi:predicted DNA-binding protein YlxM (UPF0122 family)
METALRVNITYEQILSLVKQLPKQQKIRLSKELERDDVGTGLSELLKSLRTDELSLDTINEEVEIVRQQIYDCQKVESYL